MRRALCKKWRLKRTGRYRRERVFFIEEQIRLCMKNDDYEKERILSKKINVRSFDEIKRLEEKEMLKKKKKMKKKVVLTRW